MDILVFFMKKKSFYIFILLTVNVFLSFIPIIILFSINGILEYFFGMRYGSPNMINDSFVSGSYLLLTIAAFCVPLITSVVITYLINLKYSQYDSRIAKFSIKIMAIIALSTVVPFVILMGTTAFFLLIIKSEFLALFSTLIYFPATLFQLVLLWLILRNSSTESVKAPR